MMWWIGGDAMFEAPHFAVAPEGLEDVGAVVSLEQPALGVVVLREPLVGDADRIAFAIRSWSFRTDPRDA